MYADSTITVNGEWIYDIETPNEVTCPFTNGETTIQGQNISFIATGIAYFTQTPTLISPFNLQVDGTTNNGQGNGDYIISFTAPG